MDIQWRLTDIEVKSDMDAGVSSESYFCIKKLIVSIVPTS